jgi:hypothetical protein
MSPRMHLRQGMRVVNGVRMAVERIESLFPNRMLQAVQRLRSSRRPPDPNVYSTNHSINVSVISSCPFSLPSIFGMPSRLSALTA